MNMPPVKYIWRKKFNASTVLYICCRYALVANVVYLFALAGRLKEGVSHSPCVHPRKKAGTHLVSERSMTILTSCLRCLHSSDA